MSKQKLVEEIIELSDGQAKREFLEMDAMDAETLTALRNSYKWRKARKEGAERARLAKGQKAKSLNVTKKQAGEIIGYSEIDTRAFVKKVPHTTRTFVTTRAVLDDEKGDAHDRIERWAHNEVRNREDSTLAKGYNVVNVQFRFTPEKAYGAPIGERIFITFTLMKK